MSRRTTGTSAGPATTPAPAGPGIFVYGMGTAGALVAGEVLPDRDARSPLPPHAIALLTADDQQLHLHGAKRKLTVGFKPDGRHLLSVPRTALAGGRLRMGTPVGLLELALTDGSAWLFEVPRIGNGSAPSLALSLGWQVP